ncbi:MAG TPA: hypothetical protein DCW44_01035, partial [Eubacterium sp.]|nr:hypothetical protein [Eubacterium sp.]
CLSFLLGKAKPLESHPIWYLHQWFHTLIYEHNSEPALCYRANSELCLHHYSLVVSRAFLNILFVF